MPSVVPQPARNAAETRARILEAAQTIFAEKGYSQTGLREIAAQAGVVSSLLVKYFRTKANLFEEALASSLREDLHLDDKPHFAERLMKALIDPNMRVVAPAMIALSLGDEEARDISSRVARQYIIAPLAAWIGPPHGEARAASAMMLSVGFAIFTRHLQTLPAQAEQNAAQDWLVRTIQAVLDGNS